MATTIETTEHQLPGCKVCAYAEVKRSKPSDGFLDEEECEGMCEEDGCVKDCECGECFCETLCAETEGDDCLDDCCFAECIEDRMYATRWDSLYFDGLGPTAGLQRWTVDYEMCSPKELKRMVQNRGLVDPYPAGTTMKYYYVRTLTEADLRLSTFRFMDLPAEMRSLVYIQLLTFPVGGCHKHRSCFPQILRTSRQVHEEAEEMLYAENTIDCDFKTKYIPCGWHSDASTSTMIDNKEVPLGAFSWGLFDEVQPLEMELPSYLRRIQSLRININVTGANAPSLDVSYGNAMMRRSILRFASALMDQNCLKHVQILAEDDGVEEEWPGIADVMQPLRRIRNVANVAVCGKVNALAASALVKDMEGDSPTFNTIKQFILIMMEAEAYESLHASIDPIVKCDNEFAYRDSTLREVISHHLCQIRASLISEMDIDMFANEQSELDLQIRLAKIQTCLDKVGLESATKQLEIYAAARKIRSSYASAKSQKSIDFKSLQRERTPSPFVDEEEYLQDM